MVSAEMILISYLLGVVASLSLCVIPLLPLSVLMMTDSEENSSRGIAVGFSVTLGVLTSFSIFTILSGYVSFFLITNYVVIAFVLGLIMVLFGLIALSPARKGYAHLHEATRRIFYRLKIREGSLFWAFAAGLLFALVSAPCGASIYVSAIIIFSVEENVLFKVLLALMFSFGVGTIFVMIGTVFQRFQHKNPDRYIRIGFIVGRAATLAIVILGLYMMIPFILTFTRLLAGCIVVQEVM